MGKESACNAGDIEDTGLSPGLGRSPEGGNGNELQYSCLKNPIPCVVLGFSFSMEAFDELLSINVPWSQEFPGVRVWT